MPGHREEVVKDIQLSLGFRAPISPSLRSMDIMMMREDISGFVHKGKLYVMIINTCDPCSREGNENGTVISHIMDHSWLL